MRLIFQRKDARNAKVKRKQIFSCLSPGYCLPAAGYFLFLLAMLLGPSFSLAKTTIFEPPQTWRIKAGPAQRVLGVQEGVLAHTAITSSRTREVRPLFGIEFEIGLRDRTLGPEDFRVTEVRQESPGRLEVELRAAEPPLKVLLNYSQAPNSFYIEKWLEIFPDPGTTIFLDRVVLERFKPWAGPMSFSGPGQPVYMGDTFWGVAYPSADNRADKGAVECSYLVGLLVGDQGYLSQKSVYGVSEAGGVRKAFFAYLDQVRARPARPFLLYNTWYDLREYDENDVIRSITGFREHLVMHYRIELDSVVLDDRWDGFFRLWRPQQRRFPRGFVEVRKAAKTIGADLGLWMSPLGGYPPNQWWRLLGTAGRGLEKSPNGFCIAGRNYQQAFADRMVSYIREAGVNYYKLDNLTTFCSNPGHGHRVGKYNRVGLTDAFIRVMEKAREANPEVVINITVGSWLSPWWLLYCDVVWRGGMDYGALGVGSGRQQSITYVDKVLYKRLREEGSQFPLSSIMTHGIIKGRYQNFGEKGENRRGFADDAWMYFGRGVMMQELYLSPGMLSPGEWEALAEAISFARDHAELLRESEMVMGDPGAGEVYGFFHRRGPERLLVLRNPEEKARELPRPLIEDFLSPDINPCRVIYSSVGRKLAEPLDALEARVVYCSQAQ